MLERSKAQMRMNRKLDTITTQVNNIATSQSALPPLPSTRDLMHLVAACEHRYHASENNGSTFLYSIRTMPNPRPIVAATTTASAGGSSNNTPSPTATTGNSSAANSPRETGAGAGGRVNNTDIFRDDNFATTEFLNVCKLFGTVSEQKIAAAAGGTSGDTITIKKTKRSAKVNSSATTPTMSFLQAEDERFSFFSECHSYFVSSRRVQSAFAAARAASPAGDMLAFFASKITLLFEAGVDDPDVLAFPEEWEKKLQKHLQATAGASGSSTNSGNNASSSPVGRRKGANTTKSGGFSDSNLLYELQGFGTLFLYIWSRLVAVEKFASSLLEVNRSVLAPGTTAAAVPGSSPEAAIVGGPYTVVAMHETKDKTSNHVIVDGGGFQIPKVFLSNAAKYSDTGGNNSTTNNSGDHVSFFGTSATPLASEPASPTVPGRGAVRAASILAPSSAYTNGTATTSPGGGGGGGGTMTNANNSTSSYFNDPQRSTAANTVDGPAGASAATLPGKGDDDGDDRGSDEDGLRVMRLDQLDDHNAYLLEGGQQDAEGKNANPALFRAGATFPSYGETRDSGKSRPQVSGHRGARGRGGKGAETSTKMTDAERLSALRVGNFFNGENDYKTGGGIVGKDGAAKRQAGGSGGASGGGIESVSAFAATSHAFRYINANMTDPVKLGVGSSSSATAGGGATELDRLSSSSPPPGSLGAGGATTTSTNTTAAAAAADDLCVDTDKMRIRKTRQELSASAPARGAPPIMDLDGSDYTNKENEPGSEHHLSSPGRRDGERVGTAAGAREFGLSSEVPTAGASDTSPTAAAGRSGKGGSGGASALTIEEMRQRDRARELMREWNKDIPPSPQQRQAVAVAKDGRKTAASPASPSQKKPPATVKSSKTNSSNSSSNMASPNKSSNTIAGNNGGEAVTNGSPKAPRNTANTPLREKEALAAKLKATLDPDSVVGPDGKRKKRRVKQVVNYSAQRDAAEYAQYLAQGKERLLAPSSSSSSSETSEGEEEEEEDEDDNNGDVEEEEEEDYEEPYVDPNDEDFGAPPPPPVEMKPGEEGDVDVVGSGGTYDEECQDEGEEEEEH